jgi:hypothetical protein
MPEEHNPEQDEGVEGRFLRSDRPEDGQEEDVEGHRLPLHPEEEDDDEVEAHSMGRLSLPEDPSTRF